MSLNQIVQENSYVQRQNGKFNDTLTNTTTFDNDNFVTNGQLKCETNKSQNELVYRNEQNIFNPLSNAKQRIYQQLSPNFEITETILQSVYNDTGSIGSRTIQANTLRRGSVLELNGYGHILTSSGNQPIIFQLDIGAVNIFNQTFTLPNLPQGSDYEYHIQCTCYSSGLQTNIATHGKLEFIDIQGTLRTFYIDADRIINSTENNILNFLIAWSNTGQTLTVYRNDIYKVA